MLFKQRLHEGIADGEITLAYRRWKRPAAKVGSRHRIPVGVIEIDAVDVVDADSITDADARRSGAENAATVVAEQSRYEGDLFRVAFHFVGADPRATLRDDDELDAAAVTRIAQRLDGYDARSRRGAWTRPTLELIAHHPGVRAGDLAEIARVDTPRFKADVRKLKELGLTESLAVGYRLSPRGVAFVARDRVIRER